MISGYTRRRLRRDSNRTPTVEHSAGGTQDVADSIEK